MKDPKGSLVTNATVTAQDQAKGLERSVTGNGQGDYRIVLLPPGTYQLTVEAPGFAKTTVENVSITVGQVVDCLSQSQLPAPRKWSTLVPPPN